MRSLELLLERLEEERRPEDVVRIVRSGLVDCLGSLLVVEPMVTEELGISDYSVVERGGRVYHVIDVAQLGLPPGYMDAIRTACRMVGGAVERVEERRVSIPAGLFFRASRIAYRTGRTARDVIEEALRIGLAVLEKKYGVRVARR